MKTKIILTLIILNSAPARHLLLILLLAGGFCISAFAQHPGTLDSTFGTNGIVITNLKNDVGRAVAIQGDGKIVVTGDSGSGTNYDFVLVRYNTDGSLDSTFDSDGKVLTDFNGVNEGGNAVLIQSDGKIVVAGYSSTNGNFEVARYNTNGSLDSTFNTDGKLIIDFGGNDMCNSAALQADGKIVPAGYSDNGSIDFVLARCNSDDTLDNNFDIDGKVKTDFAGKYDWGNSVVIQSDSKLVMAGRSGFGADYDFAIARYNPDGSLDNSFDADGKVLTDFGSGFDEGKSVAIQSDGKIVVAGYSNGAFGLVRYNPDGSLDTTFSSDGKVTSTIMNGESVAIQSDGKIVVTGSNTDIVLFRYNSNGTLDTSFGTGGIATMVDIGGGNIDVGNAVAIQADGKIVVAGYSNSGWSDIVVVRYHGGGGTGIGEAGSGSEQWAVSVYPNPTEGNVEFRMKNEELGMKNSELRIYDVLGQQVYFSALRSLPTKSGQADFQLDLSILVSGIYFYQVISDRQAVARGKIVKQ